MVAQANKEFDTHPLFQLGVPILQKHYEIMQEAMDTPPHNIASVSSATHSLSGIELYAMAYSFATLLDINKQLQKELEEND